MDIGGLSVGRALKAARLAGERPERVEIDPATGRITVIIAQPMRRGCLTLGARGDPDGSKDLNELDQGACD